MSSATVSDSQSAQNIANLTDAVSQGLGLDDSPAGRQLWSQQDTVNFLYAFQQYILYNPDSFNDATIQIAQNMSFPDDLNQFSSNAAGIASDTDIVVGVVNKAVMDAASLAGAVVITADPVLAAQGVEGLFTAPTNSVPGAPPTIGQQLAAAGNAVVNAAASIAAATANAAKVLEFALPVALLLFLYYASRSTGKDPGGQFAKASGGAGDLFKTTASGVRQLY